MQNEIQIEIETEHFIKIFCIENSENKRRNFREKAKNIFISNEKIGKTSWGCIRSFRW